jgi:RNA polymerase sigma factor (sigma-70 family)
MGDLKKYYNTIKQFPILDATEEHRLICQAQRGCQKSLETVINSCLRFVMKNAVKVHKTARWVPLSDLISSGNEALCLSIKKYDPSRGVRLLTYAGFWIRNYMDQVVKNENGSACYESTTRSCHNEVFPSPEDMMIEIENTDEARQRVNEALLQLSDREQMIIGYRFLTDKPMTLREIGQKMNLTKSRIQQLEQSALQNMCLYLTNLIDRAA